MFKEILISDDKFSLYNLCTQSGQIQVTGGAIFFCSENEISICELYQKV